MTSSVFRRILVKGFEDQCFVNIMMNLLVTTIDVRLMPTTQLDALEVKDMNWIFIFGPCEVLVQKISQKNEF